MEDFSAIIIGYIFQLGVGTRSYTDLYAAETSRRAQTRAGIGGRCPTPARQETPPVPGPGAGPLKEAFREIKATEEDTSVQKLEPHGTGRGGKKSQVQWQDSQVTGKEGNVRPPDANG